MTSVDAPPHPAPPEHPERPSGAVPRRPSWSPWTAPIALVVALVAANVAYLLIAGVGAGVGADFARPPASVKISATIAQDICFVAVALLFARLAEYPLPEQFGLRRPAIRLRNVIGWMALAYVAQLVVSAVWLHAIGQAHTKDKIVDQLGAGDSTAALVAITFLVVVCAPIAEELLFRGYFFGALRRIGFVPAAVITGAAFGAVHVAGSPIAFLLPLAVFGALLCLVRERTGSLYPCVGVHCFNNALALSSLEHWSWQIPLVLVGAPAAIAAILWTGVRAWPRPAAVR